MSERHSRNGSSEPFIFVGQYKFIDENLKEIENDAHEAAAVSGPLQPNGDCNFKCYTAEVDSSQEPKAVDGQREQECDDPGVTVQADGERVLTQDDKSRPQLVDLSRGESLWPADESG